MAVDLSHIRLVSRLASENKQPSSHQDEVTEHNFFESHPPVSLSLLDAGQERDDKEQSSTEVSTTLFHNNVPVKFCHLFQNSIPVWI